MSQVLIPDLVRDNSSTVLENFRFGLGVVDLISGDGFMAPQEVAIFMGDYRSFYLSFDEDGGWISNVA
uniref:Uncharacterized protein n=1 Tax=Physcomitrium patens TaxID=3218 RepID=A0A2K1L0K7_PHYPA|nr:hypothetical protein PHYPA_002343 [Physcomitrium patens]